MTKTITIELTKDEALVLYELISQLDETESLPIKDHAEEIVFWKIEGQLERILVESFDPNYKQLIAEAKERVIKAE